MHLYKIGIQWWRGSTVKCSCFVTRQFFNIFYPPLIASYPLDVIRRRMQMKGTMGDMFPYQSTPHAFSMILKNEGIRGFYKGMLPNLLKVAPSVAIAFVTYEFVKARLFRVPMGWR